MGRSDFSSIEFIVGYGLRPSRQRPGHDWRGQRWRFPGSRSKGFCACQGLRRRGPACVLRYRHRLCCLLLDEKASIPELVLPLNTSPAPSPVNASRLPSRTARASLGPVRFATLHRDGLPPSTSCRSPGALVHTITLRSDDRFQNLALMVDGAPEIAELAVDLHEQVTGAEEFRPRSLSEPDVILSYHPAPIVRPLP
jgi:hypothetical protein